jgi:hypothetical protein
MGKARPMMSVPAVGSPADATPTVPSSAGDDKQTIKTFFARLPKPLKDESDAAADFDGKVLTIRLPSRQHQAATFFPIELPGVTYGAARVDANDTVLKLTIDVQTNPANARGKPMKIAGVVGLGESQNDPCFEFELPVPAP